MGTALGPSHLLSLDKSLTQNLVDGRLNKGRGNGFSMPITVAVIGNKGLVGRPRSRRRPLQPPVFPGHPKALRGKASRVSRHSGAFGQ
jgi:hypothetical protein